MNDRRPALRKLGRNQCTCQRGIYIAQPQQDVGRFRQQRRLEAFHNLRSLHGMRS
jgi:hypothetical protein